MRLIFPFRILRNWGISSINVSRRNLPVNVTRGSLSTLNCGPSTWFFDLSFCWIESASGIMVLNFMHENSLPRSPWRLCPKKIRPGESIFINIAIIGRKGMKRIITISEIAISASRFMSLAYEKHGQSLKLVEFFGGDFRPISTVEISGDVFANCQGESMIRFFIIRHRANVFPR